MSEAKSLSREQWQELIDEQEGSGLTIVAFCQERELGVHRFHYHKHKLREEALSGGFREVPASGTGTIRMIRGGSGWQVEVQRGFDAGCLRELLRVLG